MAALVVAAAAAVVELEILIQEKLASSSSWDSLEMAEEGEEEVAEEEVCYYLH